METTTNMIETRRNGNPPISQGACDCVDVALRGVKNHSRGKRKVLICVVDGNGNDDVDRLGDTTKTNQH